MTCSRLMDGKHSATSYQVEGCRLPPEVTPAPEQTRNRLLTPTPATSFSPQNFFYDSQSGFGTQVSSSMGEQRSPKPEVEGSTPSWPAIIPSPRNFSFTRLGLIPHVVVRDSACVEGVAKFFDFRGGAK